MLNQKIESVLSAAAQAWLRWCDWQDADGLLPEPEYDDLCSAMTALGDALRDARQKVSEHERIDPELPSDFAVDNE